MDIPSYILGRIKGSGGAGVSYIVVEELPTTGEEGKIYLVPKSTSQTDNVYNEYMYINEEWELIGDTQADLSDYLQEGDLKTINGNSIVGSGDLEIDSGTEIETTDDITIYLDELKPTVIKCQTYNQTVFIYNTKNGDRIESFNNYQVLDEVCIFKSLEEAEENEIVIFWKTINNETVLIKKNSNAQYGVSISHGYSSFMNYALRSNVLEKNNSTSYTPTGNYNPATKKYVDDSILLKAYQLAGLSAYSSSSTYAVGDYVYYNNLIYKCSTAVETAEAFDSNKWTQKTYMEYMSDTLVGTALGGSY